MPKPDIYGSASSPLRKMIGFVLTGIGLSLGYVVFSFAKHEFQIPFIILSASAVLLLLFGGWFPSLISAGLAGGLKFLATMN